MIVIRVATSTSGICCNSLIPSNSKILAPTIAGINNKKANLPDSFLPTPWINPVLIVVPERDTPGNIAKACAQPIIKAFPKDNSLAFLTFLFDANKKIAVSIKENAIIRRSPKAPLIKSLNTKPTKAIGMLAKNKKLN